tara:strand:- start:54 stop:506 length:453 start_codon:yes stop_codon:yes gene_type:complete
MAIKKIYRTHPDPILVKAEGDKAQGAIAKIAHVNWLIEQIDEPPVQNVSGVVDVSGAINFEVDIRQADYFNILLPAGAGPYTISFSYLTVGTYIVYIKQNAAGNGVATLTGVEWPAATAPTITATPDKVDIITLVYDGTTLRGSIKYDYV